MTSLTRLMVLVLLPALSFRAAAAENPFPVSVSLAPSANSGERPLEVAIFIPEGYYLYDDMLAVTVDPPAVLDSLEKPEPEWQYDVVTETNRAVHTRTIRLSGRVRGVPAEGLRVTVDLQGCKGELCFLPETLPFVAPASGGPGVEADATREHAGRPDAIPEGFSIRNRAEGYMKAPAFLDFLAGKPPPGGRLEGWLGLLLILLGGLALNLTPCVLPMIPVNLALIGAGARAGSRRRGFLLGSLYGLGMAAAYGALGIVVVLTGAVFGTLNASPWFNLAFAVLFVAMALALFGVFNLDLTRFQPVNAAGRPAGGRAAYGLAFGLGALSALLAGACVAPVVVAVLARAADLYASGSRIGLFLPLVLGLGMALPWPLAGAGMAVLPKPGRWMEWVKYAMGTVVLVLALNYAWNAWNGFRWKREGTDSPEALRRGLAESARTGRPVFIDFWATWCKSCRTMDETTFRDAAVKKALESFIVVKYQAERPDEPETQAVLEAYGVKGLPTYVILEPARGEGG